jgi:hypothetical protein
MDVQFDIETKLVTITMPLQEMLNIDAGITTAHSVLHTWLATIGLGAKPATLEKAKQLYDTYRNWNKMTSELEMIAAEHILEAYFADKAN